MAGRIPQQFIDTLLDRTDIVEVIDRRVPLKKAGRNFSACCPFHDEKTPSFSVSPDKQFYYCFGCGAGGNAIGFLIDYERLEFPQAVEVLADAAGLDIPREETFAPEQVQQQKTLYSVLDQAAAFYREQLRRHPQRQRAIDYLKQRGLSGEIANQFGIGYAPPGWDNLLTALTKTPDDRQQLIDAGLVVDKPEEQKCYDRFRDRIMFPIRDNRGRVIAFGGRVLGDDKPKYLNSPETEVFHKQRELYGLFEARRQHRQLQQLLVVEGYMDVVALAQNGLDWAVATLGTATSSDHLQKIFRHCPTVVFCFDGDEAGKKAARRALEASLPTLTDGRQARFLFLPAGEDPDSMVRAIGASEFQRLIDKATTLEKYLFDDASTELDLNSLDGRAKLSKRLAPLLQQLPDGVYKALLWEQLAQRTGLDQSRLMALLQEAPAPTPSQSTVSTPASAVPVKRQPLPGKRPEMARQPLQYALALALHQPRCLLAAPLPAMLAELDDPAARILVAMASLIQKRPESTTAMLLGHWHGAPEGKLLRQLLEMEQTIPTDNLEAEFCETIHHLEREFHHLRLDAEVDKLLARNYSELSPDEKMQLKQLLSERVSK